MERTTQKNILLAVCGGIAAYKAAELVRLLRQQGHTVKVVMTASAQEFVGPLTFQALSGNPVYTEALNAGQDNGMEHISLTRWAELMLIAPATANTIAKCVHGFADNLVTALYLAANCPVFMAPAMNQAMWNNPATQENIRKLEHYGVTIIGPDSGEQACGETGYGRMAEPVEICRSLIQKAENANLQGIKVLISAGPTQEDIDPVRYITNRSSGKMGYALARAAVSSGAEVTLVSGPVKLTPPPGVRVIQVKSADQMYDAVMARANDCEIYIGAAAVADYAPVVTAQEKIKKNTTQITLSLTKTKDILAGLAQLQYAPFTVGFAAETTDLENYAQTKLRSKKLAMIAANWVSKEQGGFDSEQNALEVFWNEGSATLPMMDKYPLAKELIKLIALRFYEKNRI